MCGAARAPIVRPANRHALGSRARLPSDLHPYSNNMPPPSRRRKNNMNFSLSNSIRGARSATSAVKNSRRSQPMKAAALLVLSLALPVAASAADPGSSLSTPRPNRSPLVDKVRAATERYQDINVALHETPPFVVGTPCVTGPNEGAMGVHLVRPDRIFDGILNAEEPEALIYEPGAGGTYRFVGVEFIAAASTVDPGPSLEGHLLNYVGEPNRYGLPAFYEIHVWAWEDNPKGNFVDWNTNVSCDKQAGT